jgi:hypothetical protein
MNIAKSASHNKTTDSAKSLHNAESLHEDQRKPHEKEATLTPKNNTDETISLKPLLKKEF